MRGAAWAEGSFSARFGLRGGLRRLAEVYGGGFGGVFWRHRAVSRAAMPSTFMVGARFAKTLALIDYDVSGTAPPFCMMSAQRSRIAANTSSMAALIFKYTRRPWRTILPAV